MSLERCPGALLRRRALTWSLGMPILLSLKFFIHGTKTVKPHYNNVHSEPDLTEPPRHKVHEVSQRLWPFHIPTTIQIILWIPFSLVQSKKETHCLLFHPWWVDFKLWSPGVIQQCLPEVQSCLCYIPSRWRAWHLAWAYAQPCKFQSSPGQYSCLPQRSFC